MINLIEAKIKERFNEEMAPKIFEKKIKEMFSNNVMIIDEAQNLTPHEVKTIISRAGDDTKIVFMGDIHQIDTPYLDSQSNGLSYLIDKIKDNPLFAHITLKKGERSELANIANHYL